MFGESERACEFEGSGQGMKSPQQSEFCPQICRGWIAPDGFRKAGATPTRHAWRVTPCGRQRGSRQPSQPNFRTVP